jgi:hypothetical protein
MSRITRRNKRIRIRKTTSRSRRTSRRNRTRKQKGGVVYGRGYGANCYDPNDSIYNTNMLKLFPYSPK